MGVVVGTLTQALIVPNFLSTEENGLLAMLMSWMLILVFVANLGFNAAGVRFFDRFRNADESHRGFLFNGLFFTGVGFLLVLGIAYFFKDHIVHSKIGDSTLFEKYYYYILPLTFFTVCFNLFDNYAKGLYDTVAGNFLSQFLQRLLVLLTIVLYAADWVNLNQFVFLWVIGMSLPAVLMAIHAKRLGDFSLKPNPYFWNSEFRKEFFTFAGFSMVTGLSSIVITKLDILMVYDYLGLSNSGIYNTSILFGSVMTMSYLINLKASTAIVLDAMAAKDYPKVQQIFNKSSVTQMLFGTLLLSLVWVNVDTLFSFIKPEYAAGKYVLLIIGLAKLYDLASGINTLILSYSKYYKLDSLLVLTFIGLLFLLNHLLIPRFGLNGAAIAALIATAYYNSLRNYLIWRFFKIHPYSWKLLYILAFGILLVLIGQFLPNLGSSVFMRLLSLSYKCTLLGGLYLLFIYKSNFSKEINELIDRILGLLP